MYVFGYIIYWQLNKKLNCLLFSLILFLLVQGNCVHKTRLGDQCSQLLASIKIQCLNLNFFLEVSTMPHKSFIALSGGLGVGDRGGHRHKVENFVLCCRNQRITMKENAQNDVRVSLGAF